MDEWLALAVIAAQLLVAGVTAWTARATKRAAEITEKSLQRGMRPLIRAKWKIVNNNPNQEVLVADINEVTGVLCDVREATARVQYADGRSDNAVYADLSSQPLHRDAEDKIAIVLIDHPPNGEISPGQFAVVEFTLVVSAVGADDPRKWRIDANVFYSESGGFRVSSRSFVADAMPEKKRRWIHRRLGLRRKPPSG